MFIFTTKLRAVDPKDGELKTWAGPRVKAITPAEARHKIQDMGCGYLELDGYLNAEIDEDTGEKTEFIFWN